MGSISTDNILTRGENFILCWCLHCKSHPQCCLKEPLSPIALGGRCSAVLSLLRGARLARHNLAALSQGAISASSSRIILLHKVGNSTVLLVVRDAPSLHQPLERVGSKIPFAISTFLHPIPK